MTLFDALKTADIKTVGNVSVGAGIALGVYETFAGSKPSYLWPAVLVGGGAVLHIATMNPKSVAALGQASAASASSGAGSGGMTTCQKQAAATLKENDEQVKKLPWVVGGAAVALLALKILL